MSREFQVDVERTVVVSLFAVLFSEPRIQQSSPAWQLGEMLKSTLRSERRQASCG